jgi:putative FmdB family regulatory protein
MPIYEYRCKDCRHELEAQQSFSDEALTECPSCGGTLKKKFSSVGISFKGSGFYKTDSRGAAASGAKSTTESSDKGSGSGDGAASATPSTSSTDSAAKPSTAPKTTDGGGTKAPAAASA